MSNLFNQLKLFFLIFLLLVTIGCEKGDSEADHSPPKATTTTTSTKGGIVDDSGKIALPTDLSSKDYEANTQTNADSIIAFLQDNDDVDLASALDDYFQSYEAELLPTPISTLEQGQQSLQEEQGLASPLSEAEQAKLNKTLQSSFPNAFKASENKGILKTYNHGTGETLIFYKDGSFDYDNQN